MVFHWALLIVLFGTATVDCHVVEEKLFGSGEAVVMNNIGYLLKGYDIMRGNPLPVVGLSQDPGYRQPIFEATYKSGSKTADERYLQPDGTTITDCSGTCSLSFQTDEISGSKSYQDTLSSKASFTLGASFFPAKFSASADYKKVQSTTSSGSNLYTQSSASCCSYKAQILGYNSPPLSKNFLTAVESLTDEYNENVYQKLIENFGTHYITEAQMGALYCLQSQISKKNYTSMLEKGLTISTAAKVQAKGVAVGGEFSKDSDQKMAEEFYSSVTTQNIFTIGVPPPTDHKVESWMHETSSAPAPMKLILGSIMDLFDSSHGIEVTEAVKENMQKALMDYCLLLKERGEVSTCEAPGPDPPKPVRPIKRTWMGWYMDKLEDALTNPVKQCADGHYVDRMIWMAWWNGVMLDLKFSCSDGTIYSMTNKKEGKYNREMNCEGSKGGFRQMTAWSGLPILNVRSFCLNEDTQQTANDGSYSGGWGQTKMCNEDEKIVGIQTQEEFGILVNFQFQCAFVPPGTDSGCVKQENIDYYGNGIPDKNKVVSGLEECINWCGETAECRYWTFAKSDRHCYLKTSNIGVMKNADEISGTKNCADEISACSGSYEYGVEYPSNDIKSCQSNKKPNPQACQEFCKTIPGCVGWEWGYDGDNCCAKSSMKNRNSGKSGRVSGLRDNCPPE